MGQYHAGREAWSPSCAPMVMPWRYRDGSRRGYVRSAKIGRQHPCVSTGFKGDSMEQFGQDSQRTLEGSGAGTSHVTIITTYRLEISPFETTERTGAPFACLLGLRGAVPVKKKKRENCAGKELGTPSSTSYPFLPTFASCCVLPCRLGCYLDKRCSCKLTNQQIRYLTSNPSNQTRPTQLV